jgi:hypothetical protein
LALIEEIPMISPANETAFTAALAAAFRRKAEAKREQVREGTTHPDKFPDVDIRSPEAAIAAQLAQSFEAMADDIEAIR